MLNNEAIYLAIHHTLCQDWTALEDLFQQRLQSYSSSLGRLHAATTLFIGSTLALGTGDGGHLRTPQCTQLVDDCLSGGLGAGPAVLFSNEERVHTSTLGLVYGALRNSNLFLKREEISQFLREGRAFAFENLIAGGMLMSDDSKSECRFDTLLSCVPFGLFEPEDLVLVEAVKCLTKQAMSGHATNEQKLLLSWYYVEQGSYDKARSLLLTSSEPQELKALVTEKLRQLGQLEETFILHEPEGYGNRYEPQAYERHPYQPYGGDTITIDAVSVPLDETHPVVLTLNGQTYAGTLVNDRWRFTVQGCEPDTTYTYHLAFEHAPEVRTESFTFHAGRRVALHTITKVRHTEDQVTLIGTDDRAQYEFSLHLSEEAGKVKWRAVAGAKTKGEEAQAQTKDTYVLGDYRIAITHAPFTLDIRKDEKSLFTTSGADAFQFGLVQDTVQEATVKLRTEGEKFYGLGERYNALNQQGERVDQFVYNQYKDQGIRTYIPMPILYTTGGYGIHLNTSSYSWVDMGKEAAGVLELGVEENTLSGVLVAGSLLEQVRQINRLNGPAENVPSWALGPWMSSNNWDSDAEVRKQVELTKQHDIPSTVLVIEAWSDEATFYIFNDAVYEERTDGSAHAYDDYTFPEWGRWPDPKGLVEYLHENDLKCILWQIPIIKQITSLNHLQKSYDEARFIDRGYGVTHPDGKPFRMPEGWFKDSLLMDFSHEEGCKWWFDKRQYLIDDLKVDGFKTDGGEFVFGRNLQFADGRTGLEMRNEYPNDYIEAYYTFAQQNDGITFSRAGYTGAQKFPAHWAGDERSTFDAFQRSMHAGLSAGLSGVIFWGWDLGGFSGDVPTAELFIRSAQMAAFCPIMQYHAESKAELNQDRTPWNIADRSGDPRAISLYRYYANLRMSFLPYIVQEADRAVESGEPLMRALVLDYEKDTAVHEIWDTYLFGTKLLVAPVMEEGAVERPVYLPEGRWWHMFEQGWMEGSQTLRVKAELEDIPVFIKENEIIPLNMSQDGQLGGRMSSTVAQYDHLTFLVTGTAIEAYSLQTPEGESIQITVQQDEKAGSINVGISGAKRPVTILFACAVDTVLVNGEPAELERLPFSKVSVLGVRVKP